LECRNKGVISSGLDWYRIRSYLERPTKKCFFVRFGYLDRDSRFSGSTAAGLREKSSLSSHETRPQNT
jgi:hypothetical protein